MKVFVTISVYFLFVAGCATGSVNELQDYKKELELHPYPVLQGLTTSDATQITVLLKQNEKVQFKVLDSKDAEKAIHETKELPAGKTGFKIYHLRLTGLEAEASYLLQILDGEKVLDQRRFQTLDLNKKSLKVGVASCMNDSFLKEQFEMWNDYFDHDPEYTFLIGDNVYSDYMVTKDSLIDPKAAKINMLWRRYVETWSRLAIYRMSKLTPTLAIWDDHDYGVNDGDATYPYKTEALEILRSFYAIDFTQKVVSPLPGAGFIFDGFGQRFVFADARSFRSPRKQTQGAETQWGEEQKKTVLDTLNKKPSPTWLIEGDQFFGAYHNFESYEKDHPKDFKNLLDGLKKSKSPVFFVSGDRHLNEFMRIEKSLLGYETYELTSSAIHANVYPNSWAKNPNPRQMHGESGIRNYSIVESNVEKKWNINVKSYGPEIKLLYDVNVEIVK